MLNSRITGFPLKTGCQLLSKQCFGQEILLVALCGEHLMISKVDYTNFSCIPCNFSYGRRPTILLAHFVYFVGSLGTCFFPLVFTLITEESTRWMFNALALSVCR